MITMPIKTPGIRISNFSGDSERHLYLHEAPSTLDFSEITEDGGLRITYRTSSMDSMHLVKTPKPKEYLERALAYSQSDGVTLEEIVGKLIEI